MKNLQVFIEEFPNSDLVPEAERLLKVCRLKLAEKDFKAGELYRKLQDYDAALVYFNSVIDSYYDTKFIKGALFWKGESLFRLARYNEAQEVFLELLAKYPKNEYGERVKARLREIQAELATTREANGVAPSKKTSN